MLDQENFAKFLLPELLPENRELAQKIFTDYGEAFSNSVVTIMVIGLEYEKVSQALEGLEDIYEKHVKDISTEMRFTVSQIIEIEYFTMLRMKLSS